MQPEGRY